MSSRVPSAANPCSMLRRRPNSFLRHSSASLSEPGLARDQSLRGWRRHDVHIDHFKPEAGDPLQQPREGSPIGQLGAENRCTATYSDFAVIEFRAQRAARLARERDLVCLWSHYGYPLAISYSRAVHSLCQSAWPPDRRHHPPAGDPGPWPCSPVLVPNRTVPSLVDCCSISRVCGWAAPRSAQVRRIDSGDTRHWPACALRLSPAALTMTGMLTPCRVMRKAVQRTSVAGCPACRDGFVYGGVVIDGHAPGHRWRRIDELSGD